MGTTKHHATVRAELNREIINRGFAHDWASADRFRKGQRIKSKDQVPPETLATGSSSTAKQRRQSSKGEGSARKATRGDRVEVSARTGEPIDFTNPSKTSGLVLTAFSTYLIKVDVVDQFVKGEQAVAEFLLRLLSDNGHRHDLNILGVEGDRGHYIPKYKS